MLSSECSVQGKENGITCISPLIHRQPHRGRARLKALLEGRRQWSTNSPVPFMRFIQRDTNDRPLHGLIYGVRRPEEQLCRDRGRLHFPSASDAPCFLLCPRQICRVLSLPCVPWWLISMYFSDCQNFFVFKSLEHPQNLGFFSLWSWTDVEGEEPTMANFIFHPEPWPCH